MASIIKNAIDEWKIAYKSASELMDQRNVFSELDDDENLTANMEYDATIR